MTDSFDLQRFRGRAGRGLPVGRPELSHRRKQTHWMWFIFPQIASLGFSSQHEIFAEAIAAFYPDGKDRATLAILETHGHS